MGEEWNNWIFTERFNISGNYQIHKEVGSRVSFDEETGYYFHEIPSDFNFEFDGYIQIDNPVGVYLLEGEEASEVKTSLSEIFHELPFNKNILDGIEEIKSGLDSNYVTKENCVSIHIRRGDAVDYAKKDAKAYFERIVPLSEYATYIQEKAESGIENVILASDDEKVKKEMRDSHPEINFITIEDIVDNDDWSQAKIDIGDLYFLSTSSEIASGFTAYSIVAGLAGDVDIKRLAVTQDILERIAHTSKQFSKPGVQVEQDDAPRLESLYGYSTSWLIKRKKMSEAMKMAQRMREDLPESALSYNLLGNISFMNSEYKEAAKFQRLAIKLEPRNPHFHIALSHALYSTGELIESKKSAENAFFLMPNNQNAIRQIVKINDIEGIHRESLIALIYLEITQNGTGKNIPDIRKRLDLIDESEIGEFEIKCKDFLKENQEIDGVQFIDFVRDEIRFAGSSISEEIKGRLEEIWSKQPTRKFILSRLKQNENSELCLRFSTERFIQGRRALIGGLADRLKGAATVMLASVALSRRFEIEWKHPEEIGKILLHKEYDWSVRIDESKIEQRDLIDSNFSAELRKTMLEGDIEKVLDIENKGCEIFCNSIDLGIGKNQSYQLQDSDLIKGINRAKLVGTLLSLFEYRPGPEETMMMMAFLDRLRIYENSIAIHFRTGGDGDWRDPEMDDRENVEILIEKAKDISDTNEGNTCVYFASDSDELKSQIIERYGNEIEIFSVNVPLAHIDRSDLKNAIMGSRFAIMENFMISCCDKILCGRGAFAELASNRRFVDPWRYF